MGAGASTEGVQGLPSDPSEWTARHVELCLASLKLEAFVPAARAAELNGSVLEKMEAHPDGFAAALSGIDFDDAAAQKVTYQEGVRAGQRSTERSVRQVLDDYMDTKI